jgi:hypothetical protein
MIKEGAVDLGLTVIANDKAGSRTRSTYQCYGLIGILLRTSGVSVSRTH